MSDGSLDSLVKAVTTIFVLSLAVERIAALFKAHDLQPLRPRRDSMKKGVRVDLARDSVVHVSGGAVVPVADPEQRRYQRRAVITENTVFLGMAMALLTGANALEGLPGVGKFSQMAGVKSFWATYLLSLPGILLTGAAAGIGSSFWYDLLGLLIEVRRTKQAITTSTTALSAPGADLTALKDQSTLFMKRRQAASEALKAGIAAKTYLSGEVVDILEDPYIAIRVRVAPGQPAPAPTVSVTVDGSAVEIPVRVET